MVGSMNSFRCVHIEAWSCRSLAPIRYTACAIKGNSHMLIKSTLILFTISLLLCSIVCGQERKETIQNIGGIKMPKEMKILFVAGFGPIVQDDTLSQKLYLETLGLPLKKEENNYCHTQELAGVKYFALWPLSQAAESCFGSKSWPKDIPIPQVSIEFEVEDIATATEVMKDKGYKLLVSARKEPWGQTVTRFLSPEGILLGLTYTPWMRSEEKK